MARMAFIAIIFTVVFILAFRSYILDRFSPPPAPVSHVVSSEPLKTQRTTGSSTAATANTEKAIAMRQKEIETLQLELAGEQSKLADLRRNVEGLQAQRLSLDQQIQIAYPSQIMAGNNEIQNLMDEFSNQRMAENDINDRVDLALKQQSSTAEFEKERIDTQIEMVQENLRQIQDQIQNWTFYMINMTDRYNALLDLQDQQAQNLEKLNQLRNQRMEIASQVLERAKALDHGAQIDKQNVINAQASLQNHIADLREHIRQLQEARAQAEISSKGLDNQIAQAQAEFNAQNQKVQQLSQGLQNKDLTFQP
jgi:chromosome segregation ATPase